jgi:hypothetical protein
MSEIKPKKLEEFIVLVKTNDKENTEWSQPYESHHFASSRNIWAKDANSAVEKFAELLTEEGEDHYYDRELVLIGNEGKTIFGPFRINTVTEIISHNIEYIEER